MKFKALYQDARSLKAYPQDLEPFVRHLLPQNAIAEKYLNGHHEIMHGRVLHEFQGKDIECWHEMLDSMAKLAKFLWQSIGTTSITEQVSAPTIVPTAHPQ